MTKTIIFKVNEKLFNQIDSLVETNGYTTRTDFIKAALHEKIEKTKLENALIELSQNKGKSKNKINDKKIHKAREDALKELLKTK